MRGVKWFTGAALLSVALVACGAPTVSTEPTSEQTAVTSSASKAPKPKAKAGTLTDDGMEASNIKVKDDGLGDFGGSVRVRNTTKDDRSFVSVTITLFDTKGETVGILNGIADDIAAGKTVTVQLISTDKVTKFKTAEFQVS